MPRPIRNRNENSWQSPDCLAGRQRVSVVFPRARRTQPRLVHDACCLVPIPDVARKRPSTIPSSGVTVPNRRAQPPLNARLAVRQRTGTFTRGRSRRRSPGESRTILVVSTADIDACIRNLRQAHPRRRFHDRQVLPVTPRSPRLSHDLARFSRRLPRRGGVDGAHRLSPCSSSAANGQAPAAIARRRRPRPRRSGRGRGRRVE